MSSKVSVCPRLYLELLTAAAMLLKPFPPCLEMSGRFGEAAASRHRFQAAGSLHEHAWSRAVAASTIKFTRLYIVWTYQITALSQWGMLFIYY